MLKIEHLTKHYAGTEKGITDLTIHVRPGDLFAFIGHNGAGKTTTLKTIAGIHDFNSGSIQIHGRNLKEAPLLCKQDIAYIPDEPELYEYLTGIQYLNFMADIFNLSANQRKQYITEYGEIFGITQTLGRLISTYSHGMKQKLALVGGLIHMPKLLILDEPFVGLDPQAIFSLKKIMQRHCAEGGAVFFSTHILDVAEKLCNRVAMIKSGKLMVYGNMEDIIKSGQSLETVFLEVQGYAEATTESGM